MTVCLSEERIIAFSLMMVIMMMMMMMMMMKKGWKTKWVVTRLRIWMGHLSSHCPTTPVYNVQHKLYTIILVQQHDIPITYHSNPLSEHPGLLCPTQTLYENKLCHPKPYIKIRTTPVRLQRLLQTIPHHIVSLL